MKSFPLFLAVFILVQLSSILNSEASPVSVRVNSAVDVVTNRMTSPQPIPDSVISVARCIAALKVVKAGFIWGGQGSTGLLTCRTPNNEWSEPSFFSVNGVNFGFQIGVQFLESILVFITDSARQILDHPSFTLGTELSVAAGPVGGGGGVGAIPNAQVLSYQRAVGLYAGATVDGFVLSHNPKLINDAYGASIEPHTLLNTSGTSAPASVQPFLKAMDEYLPPSLD